jgi:hypothetical protein
VITLTLQRISGDLDPVLILADAEGNVILINDEDPASPGSLDAAISNFRIEASGNYLVAATRFGGQAGPSNGAYSLRLTRALPSQLGFSLESPLTLEGTSTQGAIANDAVSRFYLIDLAAGVRLTAEARSAGAGLDPVLRLYRADGRLITNHDTGARGRYAQITSYSVAVAGAYILEVSRFGGAEGRTSGNYTLTLKVE